MAVEPAEFPPPIKPAEEFIAPITDPEEERIEVGVAIVGGGPAGLACAIRLMQLLEDEPELTEKLGEVPKLGPSPAPDDDRLPVAAGSGAAPEHVFVYPRPQRTGS